MIVLSTRLSTEQVVLIVRAIIQALSYGVPFLLGYLILWNAPRVAPLETHDLLNRLVGQSTSFFATFRWIFRRLFRGTHTYYDDPISSTRLLIVLVVSLCYGGIVSISDLGILGINSCTIPVEGSNSSFTDFPASVRSDEDALNAIMANMLKGADPNSVNAYRCEASVGVVVNPVQNLTVCNEWSNSTYGDSLMFSNLNSTDSDVLMPSNNFAHDYLDYNGTSDLNMYFLGAGRSALVTEPTIQNGIAIFPSDTGLTMIIGVPDLSKNQKVEITKTLGLEVEMGCMPLGIIGQQESDFPTGQEYFIPDGIYLSQRSNNYTGPLNLQAPLAKAADAIRQLVMAPFFNTSAPSSNGFYPSYHGALGFWSPSTQVMSWAPPGANNSADQDMEYFYNLTASITIDCMIDIYDIMNGTSISGADHLQTTASPCEFYQISGSSLQNQVPVLGHASMICATTTQVNMLSATLEMDDRGTLTYDFGRLPSVLNIMAANFFSGPDGMLYDSIWRYTLSDDSAGPTQHYIYQEDVLTTTVIYTFRRGTGNMGVALAQVGSAMLSYGKARDIGSFGVVDSDYFSTNFTTQEVTRWAGSLGASFLLSSLGYNGWAARGSPGFTVSNMGTESATCYNLQYAPAFVPLFLGSLAIMIWAFGMLFTTQISKANKLEELYGGLPTVIEFPYPGGLPSYTYLEWDDHPEPHLKPAVEKMDPSYFESQKLVGPIEDSNKFNGNKSRLT